MNFFKSPNKGHNATIGAIWVVISILIALASKHAGQAKPYVLGVAFVMLFIGIYALIQFLKLRK